MSDDEEEPVVETTEEAEPEGPMDTTTALKMVLKKALIHDGLRRGIHECAKSLEKGEAELCLLARNCDEAGYTRLVQALCQNKSVNLFEVDDNKELGEWAGLCKLDDEGNARKVVACSCVVITNFGEESEGLRILQEHLASA